MYRSEVGVLWDKISQCASLKRRSHVANCLLLHGRLRLVECQHSEIWLGLLPVWLTGETLAFCYFKEWRARCRRAISEDEVCACTSAFVLPHLSWRFSDSAALQPFNTKPRVPYTTYAGVA